MKAEVYVRELGSVHSYRTTDANIFFQRASIPT
jgi:hypothetical protein